MGFLTRLLAGLTAAAALGTGLTGTANAVDVTGAAGTTKSVVKLADDGGNETSEDTADNPDDDSTDADSTTDAGAQSDAGQQAEIQSSTSQDKATAKSSLPDHIVNGSFDYPACPDGKNSCDVDPTTGWGGFYVDYGRKFMPIPDWDRSKFGWDSSQEGLRPDQQPNSHQKLQHCVQIGNKPNNNGQKMNRFAEIIAETPDEYIYQDIATTPGVMYRWSLKHASEDASHVDSMQVMIGSPGRETAQDATRTTSNGRGDRTGVTSKTIATKGGQAEWETYTGVYVATSTVTRFTFKSAQGRDSTRGNFIDDVMFTKAYKLTYDKNSADASGQVPSNQRGKENTTQPAKTKTNGKIRLASDTSKLSDHLINSDFEYLPDGGWKTISARYDMASAYTSVDPNNGQYIRNTRHAESDTGTAWVDWDGFDSSRFAWRTDQKGGQDQGGLKDRANAVELQQDSTDGNTYAEMVASETGRTIYQDLATIPGTLYKIRLKHASLCKDNVDKMQVVINGTPIEMTRVTANGKAGDKVGEKSTTIATKVTNENRWHHADQWETYEGYYVIPDGQTTTRFGFKAVNYLDPTKGNLLDDVTFARAYKLSYDKNSTDATGEVPSNQRGKENTTQPAKTKTNGTVKTVADESVRYGSLFNGDFSYPSFSDIQKNEQENAADLRTFLKSDDGTLWYNMSNTDLSKYGKIGQIPGFDSSRFAWSSTENGSRVELQQDRNTKNTYAEIVAQQDNTSIYQNVSTGNGGVLYKIRLKHASRQSSHADRMQVLVGSDTDHATPVEMTRVTSNGHGDKVGGKSTTITTKVSNTDPRDHGAQWETYEGTYLVPEGQKNTVFMFKSLEGFKEDATLPGNNVGNLVDDIEFSRAYRLTYDKNSGDASGSVPSDTAANTVKQAKTKTNGSVRLASDDVATYAANGLPKQLVNSDFDHDWRNIVTQSKMSAKYNFANIDPAHGDVEVSGPLNGKGEASKQWVHLNGFDANKFGWKSNQTDTRVDGRGGIVEIQRSRANDNMYAEITASQAGTYLYQDIDTAHDYPTVYTVKLRYARRNGTINSNEKIQILVGAPGHEQPVEMTRIASDRGNRLGEKSTTVNAPNTDGWLSSWDTFQGSVVVPAGQNVSRFTFKALGSIDGISGNLIDDVQFKLAYKLSYDKNANDAYGQVPSDTTANTVKQAKTRTTGSVRTVADRTASGLTVHDLKKGDIAPAQYGDFKFSTTDGVTADQITDVNGFTVKKNWDPTEENQAYAGILATMYQPNKNGASLVLHHVGQWRDSSGTQRWLNAKITVNDQNLGSLVYLESKHEFRASYGKWDKHPSSRPYMDVTVDFLLDDGSTPQGLRGATGFTDLDGGTSGYNEGVELVSGFDGAYVRSDAHLARFGTNGWAGTTDENKNNADAHGMKHYVGATFTGSSFHVRWSVASGQARQSGFQPVDSTIAYRLTYNKNAQDATGSIPSDTAANTTQPAKSETDGKVSDLVQRTTTHEDGSVTVRTVDQSTDVVSGCQVYYPAGQRITLATMAKDDDCWDSSMLSRPGHTQLGWNQDRNATQAQAQVTMVEGGMTVFAVWVGNPVLTYDTNKPSTWTGEMPSTPASVSVAYNTAAADGSGWQAGDVSKIRGYKFLGWYTGPQDNAGLYDWNTLLTGSVTVYAHWQRLQANVIYNANGGTGSHPNTTGWQYSDVTIPGDTSKSFKRDKYVFKGWGTKPGKADVVYKDGSKVALHDKDITLYAQWQEVHENFVETGGIGLPIAIAGGVLLLMFGIGSTVMLTRRMNGHGMPDDE